MIDDDGHRLFTKNGQLIRRRRRELILEDNVGLQMNVTIPIGVRVGERSLIGANTTIRQDVPKDTLIYTSSELIEKSGISAGLQFIDE